MATKNYIPHDEKSQEISQGLASAPGYSQPAQIFPSFQMPTRFLVYFSIALALLAALAINFTANISSLLVIAGALGLILTIIMQRMI